ncbi:MAG: hypothetical protein ACD_75C00427G0001, partial [uncultured bacterium]
MDVAVAGMHVGGDDDPLGSDLAVNGFHHAADLAVAAEQLEQVGHQFFDRGFVAVRLQGAQAEPVESIPAQFIGLRHFRFKPVRILDGLGGLQILDQFQDKQLLIIDILTNIVFVDKAGELGQSRQGQDDILIELEG